MRRFNYFVIFVSISLSDLGFIASTNLCDDYDYLDVPIDHFHPENKMTFKLRFMHKTANYEKNGPLFFHPGGQNSMEHDIERMKLFDDLADEFNAALLFSEHRFYGDSQPFPTEHIRKIKGQLEYLSVLQALMDFVKLIQYFKNTFLKNANAKVIAYGGEYSGMLAAWLRVRHPDVIHGAWSSTAPVRYFENGFVKDNAFYYQLNYIYRNTPGCDVALLSERILDVEKHTQLFDESVHTEEVAEKCKEFNQAWSIDERTSLQDYRDCERLFMFILDAFLGLADRNLPYPTDFDGLKLPAWPIKEACQSLATEEPAVQLYKFISAYYNPNKSYGSLCIYPEKCPERRYSSTNRAAQIYQMCSELPIYLGAGFTVDFVNGSTGQLAQSFVGNLSFMSWPPYYYGTDLIKEFLEDYDLERHLDNHFVEFAFGYDYATNGSTNIIFTTPELAPWSSGAVSRDNYHNSIYSFSISAAAPKHDLYQPNNCDPLSVAVQILKCWTGQPPGPGVDCGDLENSVLQPLPIVEMEDLMRQGQSECSYIHKGYPWGQFVALGMNNSIKISVTYALVLLVFGNVICQICVYF
ncbi:serine carboxypeptidase s28 domain-containing protein [Ditylenchus destructor]|uniref:Serine carboxypeptidase s28 domain-containing protein n=1 Tax=Ditylenchus destructor TaxID=166010 RepID=A0AAD4MSC0_9BILA|nr:serine carboxypeptidase s28 domain-containing protein [Ditylenchus destructor]